MATIIATIIAYIYRRRRKMQSVLDSETASIDAVEGVLGRINTQKTMISTGSSINGNYTKLSGFSRNSSDKHSKILPHNNDGILNAHGKSGKQPPNEVKGGIIRFSSEFFVGKKNKASSSSGSNDHLQRHDSGLGEIDRHSDLSSSNGSSPKKDPKKMIQNVYPSRAYKIARVNSLAPSVSGSIQNGLDQYQFHHSSHSLKPSSKKSRRKNMSYSGHSSPGTATCASSTVGSVIGSSTTHSRNTSRNSITHTNHTNHNSIQITTSNQHNLNTTHSNNITLSTTASKSPRTDQTDAQSHVSETMSGVSNSNNSVKSLPEFIPNYENLNVRVETNRASLKLTNYALPPLGTPSQSKHTMSRIISCESDYSSGCSSMGSYHK